MSATTHQSIARLQAQAIIMHANTHHTLRVPASGEGGGEDYTPNLQLLSKALQLLPQIHTDISA